MRSGIGRIGREKQAGPIVDNQFANIRQPDHALEAENIMPGDIQLGLDKIEQIARNLVIHGQADNAAPAPSLQGAFERAHQVLGFLVDFHFAVPDDPERTAGKQGEGREQQIEKHQDHFFQGDETDGFSRQPDEPIELGRQDDQCDQVLIFPGRLSSSRTSPNPGWG
jgi:hypothetical protein